ncbi:MAG: F0F1 ATP synthase subunit B' [Tropicimonas sp.]|uniref:F0F1 ATP synthase subunit B' n=1 Tax=Tropicimonas sp. TaxID=2067044 RepID=UPI003A8425D2
MAGESLAPQAGEHLDAAQAASGASLPQLDFSTYSNQIFWLIVAILAIYFILTRTALPRIAGVLAERRGAITSDIAAAEEMKLKAVEAERAYGKALAEARTNAQKIAAETRAAIKEELDVAMAKADAEISAKSAESAARIAEIRDSELAAIDSVARETAEAIVARLGRPVDAKAVAGAVETRIKGEA